MDVIADLAYPLPAIVTAEMLGVPVSNRDQFKAWTEDFAELLGNFQYNPERAPHLLAQLRRDVRLLPRGGPGAPGAPPRRCHQ